ncbi:MAG TPA: c-type cytochrome [Gammaproteobacteria bacterium]|nr:c-type cytochrome [Gammaproteobacteria bacterium]
MATNFLLIALLCIACSAVGAAQDIESGRRLYAPCAVCHGTAGEGNRAVNAPKLAGREDWYLERQLQHFRSGVRGAAAADVHGQQMANAVLVLWDEREVRDVVAFVGTLPSQDPVRTVRGRASRGKELYAVCAACHGRQAEGSVEISAPRLAGIDDWYIVNQLRLFQRGLRGAHSEDRHGQQMKPITDTLPDEQALLDIAAHINTLN